MGRHMNAVKYLNRAALIVPDDTFVLTLRAQAKMGCQDYTGALNDANMVLITLREPDNPAALIARGDAYYFLGRFEHALVSYNRANMQGNLLTKEKDHLVNVMARARTAIMNAMRNNSDAFCTDMGKMINSHLPKDFLTIDTEAEPNKTTDHDFSLNKRLRRKSLVEREADEDSQLLQEFAVDKAFLENIRSKLNDNLKIRNEVDKGLQFLNERKNFWKQHGPSFK